MGPQLAQGVPEAGLGELSPVPQGGSGSLEELYQDTGRRCVSAIKNNLCPLFSRGSLVAKGKPPRLHAAQMQAVLSLLLPCLLAQVWLVPGSTPGPRSPEAQAGLETLPTPRAQTESSEGARVLQEDEGPPWLTADWQKLSGETSNLGFSLLRKISMRHDGNVVFSPLGLAWAMAALTLGARGQSRAQLETGLRLQALNQTLPAVNQTRPPRLPALFKQLRESLSHNPELGLTQGSFAFIHEDFDVKETFLNFSKRYFDMECVTINFRNASQAKGLMNHHINKETQGKIPKLFDEINPDTKLILADYILLKGTLIMLCSPRAMALSACLFLSCWACVWSRPNGLLGTCCSQVLQTE